MNYKKYKRAVSVMLIIALLGIFAPSVIAEESPLPLVININANYYPSQTEGEYKVIFTSMTDIPAFTELGFKVALTDAKIILADFEEQVLLENDVKSVYRGESDAIYKLNRTTATGILQKTAFSNIELTDAATPTESNLMFSEFYIIDANGETIAVTPSVTFQEGPIIPELSQKEQTIYDALVLLPNPETVSYYAQDGTIVSLTDAINKLDALETEIQSLSADEKNNINTVLEYYGYSMERMAQLDALYTAMNAGIGLIEISDSLKGVSGNDLLKYQFMLAVFDSVKESVLATEFPVGTVTGTELAAAAALLETSKSDLAVTLTTSDHDDKTYACGDQISRIQALSSHQYYSEYLSALQAHIDIVTEDVNTNFDGRDESKQNLLSYLSGYKSTVQAIQSGVSDLPTMTVGEITRGNDYTVTLKGNNTLPSTSKAEVQVVVINENGTEIDNTKGTFPAANKEFKFADRATKSVYDYNMTVTVKVYYILDGASFYIGEQDCYCYTVSTGTPGIGGFGGGFGGGIPSNTTGNNTNQDTGDDNDGVSGGTIFPSEETVEPEKENNHTNVVLFHDIATYSWSKEAIEGLYYAGIVNGMEEGVYNPAGLVTREQFAKMVVQLFGLETGNGNSNFVDVKADAWYAPYITSAMQAGYIQGQSGEYFGIGESIMRQDMATILYRALGDMGNKAELTFTDKENIAPYAEDAIAELVGLGVLNGYEDGTFNPRGTATRAEAAKTIWGIYQILNK